MFLNNWKQKVMMVQVCSSSTQCLGPKADMSDSIETSAAWPRPAVPKFNKSKDSICESAEQSRFVKLTIKHFSKSI